MAERQLILIAPEGDRLPPASPFHNEGRTPAGWLVCWGLMIGSAVIGVGMIIAVLTVVIVGSAICALALIGAGALRAAGLGQPQPVLADHAREGSE